MPIAVPLAALVDYGCLSFHPWSSTAVAALQPSQIVFNLDREAIAFREVRNAALLLRDLLADCNLKAWVKTSGGQGLHVLVPIRGDVSFAGVRLLAETIVTRAIQRDPKLFSRDLRRARRRGRILIDASRNEHGATIIASYAVATSGFVSALLEWNELRRPMYPEDFGMDQVVARERGDLDNQAAFFAAEQSLDPLVGGKRGRPSTSMAGSKLTETRSGVSTAEPPTPQRWRRSSPAPTKSHPPGTRDEPMADRSESRPEHQRHVPGVF